MKALKKRVRSLSAVIAAALIAMVIAACEKSEFTMTENTEKKMVISAKNADKGDFFMVGTLEADEGEQIVITSGLTKGEVKVEIIGDQPILTANLHGEQGTSESISGTVPAGSYMMKATCEAKASGTVTIEVKPA